MDFLSMDIDQKRVATLIRRQQCVPIVGVCGTTHETDSKCISSVRTDSGQHLPMLQRFHLKSLPPLGRV
jgi:hypothetical protein